MKARSCRKHFDVWVKIQVSQVGRTRIREKSKIHFGHGVGASNINSQYGAESNILHAYTPTMIPTVRNLITFFEYLLSLRCKAVKPHIQCC